VVKIILNFELKNGLNDKDDKLFDESLNGKKGATTLVVLVGFKKHHTRLKPWLHVVFLLI